MQWLYANCLPWARLRPDRTLRKGGHLAIEEKQGSGKRVSPKDVQLNDFVRLTVFIAVSLATFGSVNTPTYNFE